MCCCLQEPSNFHQKFINECNSWLELAMIPLEGSAIAATLLEATKILAATGMPSGSNLPSPSRYCANFCESEYFYSGFSEDLERRMVKQGSPAD